MLEGHRGVREGKVPGRKKSQEKIEPFPDGERVHVIHEQYLISRNISRKKMGENMYGFEVK